MGKLAATAPAVSPTPLYLRNLQYILRNALRKDPSYESKITLSLEAKEELTWWIHNLENHNGKPIQITPPELIISSDACPEGWGAACKGQRAWGKWTLEDLRELQHINEMEIAAALRALQTFHRIYKPNSIHMKIDNMTALSYIIKMGGKNNQQMNKISKQIWEFMMSRKCKLTAEYIPSKLNIEADEESRLNDSSEWKLDPQLFKEICKRLGNPEIDLFASLATHQIPKYISWKPDPKAIAVNAFQTSWAHKFPYAFPPFKLIGRTINKVQHHHISAIIITPVWHTATWYPMLIHMSIQRPLLLPQIPTLLMDPAGNPHPMVKTQKLKLAAWLISGQEYKRKAFQAELQNSCSEQDQKEQPSLMNQPGYNLLAGVNNNTKILFNVI